MTDNKEPIARRIISYFFILSVFSICCSLIGLGVQWANRWWFHFNYKDWSFIDWWTYISVFAFIGCLFMFISPYLVKQLTVWLDYRVNKMVARTNVYEEKLKVRIQAEKDKYTKDYTQNHQ